MKVTDPMSVGTYALSFWLVMLMPLVFGFPAIVFPEESLFWMMFYVTFLLAGLIWTLIASIFKLFLSPKGRVIPFVIILNFSGFFSTVWCWRMFGESIGMGVLLGLIFISCIGVGYKNRKKIIKEGFAPKTKMGKRIMFLGGISPFGLSFLGAVMGASFDGVLVSSLVMIITNFLCIYYTAIYYKAENPD